ncbi:MAG: selenide, water dikinase SelD, partial [Pseudomonadota bacterium]
GVAGAELVMAMAHALHRAGRVYQATLIDSARILASTTDRSASVIRQSMDDLGVTVLDEANIAGIGSTGITLEDGCRIEAEFVTGAAGARAYDWPAKSGLALQDGYIAVDAELRSSDPDVFAAGDCAHFSPSPRPKAGVFAVREAPVLYNNLRAALGAGKQRRYVPQKDYLKLISLGSKSALGERFGRAVSGSQMWRWKNRIDRNFMARFTNLPEMHSPVVPRSHAAGLREAIGDKPICGGCGAKLGRKTLQAGLSVKSDTPGDDAAILQTGGVAQVLTTDHLRPLTLDPVLMTRIAANHALGDIWAMGADPQAATATIILPRLAPSLQERTLAEIMTTARATFEEAGGKIVGGHSSVGDELTIGFTVTGLCARDPITLAGGKPGDALILTKPLGSGVLMAAAMTGKAKGSDIVDAYAYMTQSQKTASKILSIANAMTDVTGFGLAGHLDGLCRLSNCGATLDLSAIPVMSGAAELVRAGVRSTLFAENRDLVPDLTEGGINDLLYDPQTAGGLLAAVPATLAKDLCADLQQAGYEAAVIGALTEHLGLRVQS